MDPVKNNTCVRCEGAANLKCSRCGTDYCSKRCQDIDWIRHCFVCFPKPELVESGTKPQKSFKKERHHESGIQLRKLYTFIKSIEVPKTIAAPNYILKTIEEQINENVNEKQNAMSIPKSLLLNNASRIFKAPFEQNIFPIGKRLIQIFILDTSCLEYGYLAGIFKDKLKELNKIQQYLSKLELPKESYVPMRDEYVLAKFNDQWYRAKVIECSADNESFQVLYIDYLNDSWVKSDEIKRYPIQLTNDCNTNLMLIDDLPEEITEDIVKSIEKEINTDRTILINQVVKLLEDNIVVVKSQEIIEILKKSKLM